MDTPTDSNQPEVIDLPALPSSSPAQPKQLTNQQLMFIHELSMDKRANAAAAARAAGYASDSAATTGWKLLHTPHYKHVREAYDQLVNARMERYNATEDNIIRELSAIAFADKRDVVDFTANGGLRLVVDADELWPEQQAQIKGLTQTETEFGTVVQVQFYSKLEALVALAKIRGMLRDKVELTIDLRLQAAAGRATSALQAIIARAAAESPNGPADGGQTG